MVNARRIAAIVCGPASGGGDDGAGERLTNKRAGETTMANGWADGRRGGTLLKQTIRMAAFITAIHFW